MTKEIKKIEDGKAKADWVEQLADHYLEFIDWNILIQTTKRVFWIYDIQKKCWVQRTMDRRQGGITLYVELLNFLKLHNVFENKFTNSNRVHQELIKIEAMLQSKGGSHIQETFPDDRYHNFLDGIYDTKDFKLLPHSECQSPKYWTTHQHQFEFGEFDVDKFDLSQHEGSLFHKLITGATADDEEAIIMIQQMLATAISPIRYPVMYIITGVAGTAKSTCLKLLPSLVGRHSTGVSKLDSFCSNTATRFSVATAVLGNKVNISEEINEKKIDAQQLKTLVTEDWHETETKGIQADKTQIHTRFYGTSNEVIQFDNWEGIDRRMKFIVLNRTIPPEEKDEELTNKIANNPEETKILFQFALVGLKLIKENKMSNLPQWIDGFYQSAESLKAKEIVRESTRPTHAFFKNIGLKESPNKEILYKTIYDVFKRYAEEEGHSGSANMSSNEFWKQTQEYLRLEFKMKVHIARDKKCKAGKMIDNKRPQVLKGFELDTASIEEYLEIGEKVYWEEGGEGKDFEF